MEKSKILLAEDEPFLGKIIKESLEMRLFEVIWVPDGLKAYSAFRTFKPDLCILDVMMPQKDGFSLAEDIRRVDQEIPVIFVTARSLTEDVIRGFESGCNDYIKKPFSMEELIVRIKALLGRSDRKVELINDQVVIGRYEFNYTTQELSFEHQSLKLSFREASLLKMLVENKNKVLDRKAALDFLWGEDNFFNSRTMDVYISKLRKHLNNDSDIEIVNIRGIGYKMLINN